MNRVRWGVLGCARVFERRMVPGFRTAANAELLAVSSRSETKAQETAAKHGIPRAYGSYEALLSDPDIEAVYIPLPNDQHCTWTLQALAAGKHVLCDKPVALSYVDAYAMAIAARSKGLRLQEGFMYRHHPQHARVREIIESSEIGEPVHFRGEMAYFAQYDSSNIRMHPAQGGGAFLDVGVYPLNAARWFFGEPEAVTAAARLDKDSGIDLHTTVLMEWADGKTATVVGGFDQPFISRYAIFGTKGSIVAERGFQIGESGVPLIIRVGDSERTEPFAHVDQYGLEITDFSQRVRDLDIALAPGEDGLRQTQVVEAMRRSVAEKRRVVVAEIEE